MKRYFTSQIFLSKIFDFIKFASLNQKGHEAY